MKNLNEGFFNKPAEQKKCVLGAPDKKEFEMIYRELIKVITDKELQPGDFEYMSRHMVGIVKPLDKNDLGNMCYNMLREFGEDSRFDWLDVSEFGIKYAVIHGKGKYRFFTEQEFSDYRIDTEDDDEADYMCEEFDDIDEGGCAGISSWRPRNEPIDILPCAIRFF